MTRFSRILLVLLVLIGVVPLSAQNATFPTMSNRILPPLIATGTVTGTPFNVSGYPSGSPADLHFWTMSWWAVGTVSTCQVKLEKSTDNSSYSDLITNQTCTSTGETSTAYAGDTNYVRLNLGTISGGGTIIVAAIGWQMNPYGTVSVSGTVSVAQCTSGTCSTTVFQPAASSLRMAGGDAAGSPTAGTVLAVQGVTSGTPVPISGNVTIANQCTSGTCSQTVAQPSAANLNATVVSTLTNDAAVPSTGNLGVLPAIANAAQKGYSEGRQELVSIDLKGNMRERIQDSAGNDRGANVTASNNLQVGLPVVTTVTTSTQGVTVLQIVAASSVVLDSISCFNSDAAANAFVSVYDAIANQITVGTTTAKNRFMAPFGSGFQMSNLRYSYTNGIAIAATTTATGSTTATTALVCNAGYYTP